MIRIDHLFSFSFFHNHVGNHRVEESNLSSEESAVSLFIYSEHDEDHYEDRLHSIWSIDVDQSNAIDLSSVCEFDHDGHLHSLVPVASTNRMYQPVVLCAIEFYTIYSRDESKRAQFAAMKNQVDSLLRWLAMSTDVFTKAPESIQVNALKRICISMFIAAALCDGIVHNRSEALDVLTHEQNLVNIAIILREALCILESCLFMAENIRSIQQRKRPGMKRLKAILAPTDVREDVKSGLTRFVGGSREWLHGEVLRWLNDRSGRRLLWLRMAAGMGKTAFCASVVGRLPGWGNRLLGLLTFSPQNRSTSEPRFVIRNLAFQIADRFPELQDSIITASESSQPLEDCPLAMLCQVLLIDPLLTLPKDCAPMLLVLDGLDQTGFEVGGIELCGYRYRHELLEVVAMLLSQLPSWVKVMMASRPDASLGERLLLFNPTVVEQDDSHFAEEARAFVRSQLTCLGSHVESDASMERELDEWAIELTEKSKGCWLYFTLVAGRLKSDLGDEPFEPSVSFEALKRCALPGGCGGMLTAFFSELRAKYVARFDPVRMLSDAFFYSHCMKLIQVVLFSLQPLHRNCVQRIVGINDADMGFVCEELHLLFPLQLNRFVVMHQTVADWFLDPTTDSRFRVDRREGNLVLVNSLLYDFEHMFVHETEIAESRGLSHAPLGTCAYAYRYLVDHCDMVTAMTDPAERDRCHISEDPCWNPHVSRYLLLKLRYIQGVIGEHGATELLSQLYSRGTNPYWNTVPDQLAVRAVWMSLHFAKAGLVANNAGDICTQLLARLAGWDANYPVLRELVADASAWFDDHSGYTFHNPVLRAPSSDGEYRLKGHTSVVNSVSLVGYDRIVSACNDKTARVWNTVTMECVCILSGHSLWVTGACGLADGRIATSSCDNTVKVWNSVSYEAEIVLNGHRSDVTCIACLSQSEVISGSKDFTIRVWNVFSSSCTQVLKGHESTVTSLCVLSDKRVVSSSKDFTVRIWSTENYACVQILRGHQSFVTGVCCMPDDSIASSSHDMTVRVWTEAGAPYEKIYVGHMNSVSSVCAIRGQGHLIASGSVDMSIPTIRVWNTVTNECECAILTEDEHSVSGLCSLLDGRLVSCSTNCDLCVWDIRRQVYRAMTNWQDYIAISGKVPRQKEFLGLAALSAASTVRVHGLRSSATSTICINNTVLSRKVNGLPLGSGSFVPSAASPTPICIIPLTNSKLIVGCGEDSLRVCDTNTLKQHFVITDGSSVLKSFCVLSSENEETGEISETIVTASPDQTLRLWNTSTGKCEGEISERPLLAMAMCALGSEFVATVSETGVLSIWDMHTRKKYREHVLEGVVGGVTAVCSYGEGYYYVVIASEDSIVRVWNAKEGDCERVLSGHTARVNAVCVLRGERVVSGSSDKTIRVWDASNGECDKILSGHTGAITAVCPLWGGRIVSGSADRTLRVWDPQRGSCIQRVELSSHDVVSLCELEDGRVASCSLDFMLCYWDTKSHLCEFATAEAGDDMRPPKSDAASESADLLLKEGNGHSDAITVLHVHGEGQILSGSKDCTVRMWDTASCSCCQVFRGHKGWIAALCSLGDGNFASGAHDCRIKIWNPDGPCIRTLRGHNFRVVVLRAQGGLLVSGSHDKAVRVWNFATGECHHVLEGHNDWISDIRPLVDGRIVSVSNESVCVWNMATGDLDHVFQGPKSVLRAVCVLSDGRIITGSNDSICGMRFTIHLWEPLADKITRVHNETVEPNESGLSSLFSLPNGRFASINNTNLVRVWCVTANEAICEKKFVLDGAVHYTESEIMSLLNGQAISSPPHPTYLDHDSCTVAIGVLPTHHGSSQLLVLGTASGKVHFAGIHCKKV